MKNYLLIYFFLYFLFQVPNNWVFSYFLTTIASKLFVLILVSSVLWILFSRKEVAAWHLLQITTKLYSQKLAPGQALKNIGPVLSNSDINKPIIHSF